MYGQSATGRSPNNLRVARPAPLQQTRQLAAVAGSILPWNMGTH